MWRDDALFLDMLIAARHAVAFNAGRTWSDFANDAMLQSATLRQLQIIGEAASKVSAERRAAHPEIPWERIIGLRHRLVHDYPRIELPKVWIVIESHLPSLMSELERHVPPEGESEGEGCP